MTTAGWDEKHLSFGICCSLYQRFGGNSWVRNGERSAFAVAMLYAVSCHNQTCLCKKFECLITRSINVEDHFETNLKSVKTNQIINKSISSILSWFTIYILNNILVTKRQVGLSTQVWGWKLGKSKYIKIPFYCVFSGIFMSWQPCTIVGMLNCAEWMGKDWPCYRHSCNIHWLGLVLWSTDIVRLSLGLTDGIEGCHFG